MKKYAIIVAGGKGLRMGNDIPKQFLTLNGKPLLMHTLQAFHDYDDDINIILVLPVAQQDYWNELCEKYSFDISYKLANGGETRFHSVLNGVNAIPYTETDAVVAVHDGVRPFVSTEVLENCFTMAEVHGAVVPVTDVFETLRNINGDSSITVDRSAYKLVQTPQTFRIDILRRAYTQPYIPEFTDDASVVEKSGIKIMLVPGNRENIKITTPFDLKVAEALLKK